MVDQHGDEDLGGDGAVGAEEGSEIVYDPFNEEHAAALQAELESLAKFNVYQEVNLQTFPKGYNKVSSRLVTTKKADGRVKIRLVAREFAKGRRLDLYIPTVSPQLIRFLLSVSLSSGFVAELADISTAFLHAELPAGETVLVVPPPELERPPGTAWHLNKCLYGLRASPKRWSEHLQATLEGLGLEQAQVDGALYHGNGLLVLAHVDDLLCVGPRSQVESFLKQLSGALVLKRAGRVCDKDWVRFCGFEYKKSGESVLIRSPESYVDGMLRLYGLDGPNVKGVVSPAECEHSEEAQELLDAAEHARYRAAVGKLIWYSQQRVDLGSAVRRVAMSVAKPTVQDAHRVKRIMRYIVQTRYFYQIVYPFPVQDLLFLHAFADASWAPYAADRRSVSGVVLKVGPNESPDHDEMVTFFGSSRMQEPIALSSAEAELYAATQAVQLAYFLKSTLLETRMAKQVVVIAHCDSSAVVQNSHRLGLGQMRHLELKHLWLQSEVRRGNVKLVKIPGVTNPADGATKALQGTAFANYRHMVDVRDMSQSRVNEKGLHALEDVGFVYMIEPDEEPVLHNLHCPTCGENLSYKSVRAADFEAAEVANPNFLLKVFFCRHCDYAHQPAVDAASELLALCYAALATEDVHPSDPTERQIRFLHVLLPRLGLRPQTSALVEAARAATRFQVSSLISLLSERLEPLERSAGSRRL